jgi:hypothetical protein
VYQHTGGSCGGTVFNEDFWLGGGPGLDEDYQENSERSSSIRLRHREAGKMEVVSLTTRGKFTAGKFVIPRQLFAKAAD